MTGQPPPAAANAQAPVAGEPIYIGFGMRLVAFIIDNIWLIILVGVLLAIAGGSGDSAKQTAQLQKFLDKLQRFQDGSGEPPDISDLGDLVSLDHVGSLLIWGLVVPIALVVVIYALCWSLTGTTPGKWLIHAKVVNARTLQPPSFMRSVVRSLAYYISLLPFGLGFLWIVVDAKKRGWHDILSGTVVIRR